MKKIIFIICVFLCISCTKQSNRQNAFDHGCGEGCYCPVYLIVENEMTADIQWIVYDIQDLCNELDLSSNNKDSVISQLKKNVNPTVPYIVTDSAYKKLIKYGSIEFDEEIYNYYKTYGVDSLIKQYDLNKYKNIFFQGNTEYKKIDYIGFLLWQNDILITLGDEVKVWTYILKDKN